MRAEILAARHRYDSAVVLAQDAVTIAAGTDLVLDHADACMALSRVLEARGDKPNAEAARRDARALYAAKGATMAADSTAVESTDGGPPLASRLPLRNRATEVLDSAITAIRAGDPDLLVALHANDLVYTDRRQIPGVTPQTTEAIRALVHQLRAEYSSIKWGTVAVRGDSVCLVRSKLSDLNGASTASLNVCEIGDDGRLRYHCVFDDNDLDAAYRVLDERYYRGEGKAHAATGALICDWLTAMDRLDADTVRKLTKPDLRWFAPASALKPTERSIDDLLRWRHERGRDMPSIRHRLPAIHWCSANCCIALGEVRGAGTDGEEYIWHAIYVCEYRDGLLASLREFDAADEVGAFAYADELTMQCSGRLAVRNSASQAAEQFFRALREHDIDSAITVYNQACAFEDRRKLRGQTIRTVDEMATALRRMTNQFSHFHLSILAVRCDRIGLHRVHWTDDAGNETTYLHVIELNDQRLVIYDGVFDEEDFSGAYREMECRYYTGEGAPFADSGMASLDYMTALNSGDVDEAMDRFSADDVHVENRSRSGFPNRSAAQLRTSFLEIRNMFASVHEWHAAVCWLSPEVSVSRFQREALGHDGGLYEWTRILVNEISGGRVRSICDFDGDDEQRAIDYAENKTGFTASPGGSPPPAWCAPPCPPAVR